MVTWKLRQGADRRIRSGHPWVFSNELASSPKGLSPGAAVTLQSASGDFLARGYGNPHSLIAFRALSFDPNIENPTDRHEIISQVISAWGHRKLIGHDKSFRLIYGEADFLPGLVIDRYVVEFEGQRAQVFVVQVLSYGMHVALGNVHDFIKELNVQALEHGLTDFDWDHTALVLRNDVQVRRLEGLEVEEPQVLQSIPDWNLSEVGIVLPGLTAKTELIMNCDLIHGQKTGFFLDQAHNIDLVGQVLSRSQNFAKPIRILDLCCYVGQWSTKLAQLLISQGHEVETTLVDVSEAALKFARQNATRAGATAIPMRLDVLEGLGVLPGKHFDIVIADPPAFIKAKKDVPTGRHAYFKMNSSAFKLVKPGGLVVSCSCSGLFEEQELMETLRKSLDRAEVNARCLVRGGHASDHPCLMSFPEGFYLKMFLHQVAFE